LKRHLKRPVSRLTDRRLRRAQNAELTDLPVHASYKIAKRLYAKGRDADGIIIARSGRRSPTFNCSKTKSANR
jgi:hypothetical protein